MTNVISFNDFKSKKNTIEEETSVYGCLVWLHCPTCKTIEYTEIRSPYGRSHKCGTQVEEVEVELDLRAEATIALINIEKIDQIKEKQVKSKLNFFKKKSYGHVLETLLQAEKTYLAKLEIAAGQQLKPYPGERTDLIEKLPIAAESPFGTAISEFRFEPEKRFNSQEED